MSDRIEAAMAAKAAKPRVELFPPEAVLGTLPALEFGADKYEPRGWEKGLDYSSVYAALIRHLFAWWGGENCDPESGLPHLSHVGANVAFLLTFEFRGVGNDDRPGVHNLEQYIEGLVRKHPVPDAPEAALPTYKPELRVGARVMTNASGLLGAIPGGRMGTVMEMLVHSVLVFIEGEPSPYTENGLWHAYRSELTVVA